MDRKLPKTFVEFRDRFPAIEEAHSQAAKAVEQAGPLGDKEMALVKIGICAGAGLESALRSHVRRALEAGVSGEEIEQAVLLSLNTVGFPMTVAAWQWARQEMAKT